MQFSPCKQLLMAVNNLLQLSVGQTLMVNYNPDAPKERGFWYDAVISRIVSLLCRFKCSLIDTLNSTVYISCSSLLEYMRVCNLSWSISHLQVIVACRLLSFTGHHQHVHVH